MIKLQQQISKIYQEKKYLQEISYHANRELEVELLETFSFLEEVQSSIHLHLYTHLQEFLVEFQIQVFGKKEVISKNDFGQILQWKKQKIQKTQQRILIDIQDMSEKHE